MMTDKIQLVIRPAEKPTNSQKPRADCFSVDGPVRLMLSVPVAEETSNRRNQPVPRKDTASNQHVVIDLTINAIHISEAPIKAGHTGEETYEELMAKGRGLIARGMEVGYVKYSDTD